MNYYLEVACPEAGAGSPPDCPDCPAALNPNLLATCTGERCVVVDLSAPGPLTRCTDDVDCIVRARDCCECGADVGVPNLVALHVDQRAQYESVVCDPDTACLECEPVYPDGVSAACNAGYCELVAMMSTP